METLADLGRLQQDDGPFLSVYAQTDQWLALREELATQGAPESALHLVDPLVNTGDTVAVIANADHVIVTEHLSDAFLYGRAQWARTADLVPLIRERQQRGADKNDVAEHTVALLEQFKTGPAADGIRATADALRRAEVNVLLVRDDRNERRDVPREDAATVDVLVRDALAIGASVYVIPASGPVTDGVGALLR